MGWRRFSWRLFEAE
uniref:Uncharacterized protein n=1 Tax=Arundo donax TaxID=35708 RepID=A0A0A8Y705_ARUDO